MPSDLPTDYAPREKLEERVRSSDRLRYEPMFEVGSVRVPFENDFDQFAATVAHALRRRLIYRTDNGRIARGLVRYTGELERIWYNNKRRQPPMDNIVMNVTFIRRKAEDPSARWVIGIRFDESYVAMEAEPVPVSETAKRHAQKQKTMAFLALAVVTTVDMGCKGDRVRSLLEHATRIGFPANQNLWFYNWRAVYEFVHNMSDDDRKKMPNAVPQHDRAYGVPLMVFPFDGRLFAPRLNRSLSWRIYPIREMAYLSQAEPATIRRHLEQLHDDVHEASDIVVKTFGLSQTSIAPSDYVAAFGKHLGALLQGKDTKRHGEESIHHLFEPKCQ